MDYLRRQDLVATSQSNGFTMPLLEDATDSGMVDAMATRTDLIAKMNVKLLVFPLQELVSALIFTSICILSGCSLGILVLMLVI